MLATTTRSVYILIAAASLIANEATNLIHIPLVSKTELLNRRLAEAAEGHAFQVDAVYQGYGTHYVDLWCGTPPQRQTVILNTGARGTAFPCSGCRDDCGLNFHTDRYFQEGDSSTFHQLTCNECVVGRCPSDASSNTCQFGIRYAEGSGWWASEAVDHCYIGGLHDKPERIDDGGKDDVDPEHAVAFGFDLHFGCQTLISGIFRRQLEDGVLSMDNSPNSFWRQMFRAEKIDDEMFSLCFARQNHADRNGTQSGAMTLGGSDDRLHLSKMVFTKHEKTWGRSFGVLVRRVYLREGGGGDSARSTKSDAKIVPVDLAEEYLNRGPVLLESGATDTFFTRDLYAPFQQAWRELMGKDYSHQPMYISHEKLQLLPTILVQLEGAEDLNKAIARNGNVVGLAGELDNDHPYDVVLAIPPNHYMMYSVAEDAYIARFYMVEPPSGASFLGANAIMGHDVLVDTRDNQIQIGFAESNCDYAHLLEKAGFGADGQAHAGEPSVQPPVSPSPATTSSDSSNGKGGFLFLFFIVAAVAYFRQYGVSQASGYQTVSTDSYSASSRPNIELEMHAPYSDRPRYS